MILLCNTVINTLHFLEVEVTADVSGLELAVAVSLGSLHLTLASARLYSTSEIHISAIVDLSKKT
jgi:hypothetical protein